MDDLRHHLPRGPLTKYRTNGARLVDHSKYATDDKGKRIVKPKHWTWTPPKRKRRRPLVLKRNGETVTTVKAKVQERVTNFEASNTAMLAHMDQQRQYKRSASVWQDHNNDTQ